MSHANILAYTLVFADFAGHQMWTRRVDLDSGNITVFHRRSVDYSFSGEDHQISNMLNSNMVPDNILFVHGRMTLKSVSVPPLRERRIRH